MLHKKMHSKDVKETDQSLTPIYTRDAFDTVIPRYENGR